MLSLALPLAAWANSVDFQFAGGSMRSIPGKNVVLITSDVNEIAINGGVPVPADGTVSITLRLSGPSFSSETVTGGSLKITSIFPSHNEFIGTITGTAWIMTHTETGGTYSFSVVANGTLNGVPVTENITIGEGTFHGPNPFALGRHVGRVTLDSGDAFANSSAAVPEPSTLGLLGTGGFSTGFVGLVGIVRRRLRPRGPGE